MNFLYGTLARDGQQFSFTEKGDGSVRLLLRNRPGVEAWVNREVILGLRPENCILANESAPAPGTSFTAVVDIVEQMGAETYYYLQTGAHSIISRNHAALHPPAPGTRTKFSVELDRLQLFDPTSTNRIY
jgi:multiple sugar transport system ATP-binding protein